ncbi:Hypothetical protein MexAM1_META1p5224 [Methylorubrum extorquens AM1]|uniref:Calcineurin-like phosphoesterase domain-containing protein n=1 Tax=Methylorubrum extorquens (strain ATCC 14718 / DSM 1338 / JCM 2805 / NCIMB 9133 / AM1) TaxID=272630 RepID=C5AV40_METEA|nr:Hypothetical protein MexAM1_META1p5224 [Methylorubrum extorquens AM1]
MLIGLGATALTGVGTGAYAVGIEPMRLAVTRYRLKPIGPWPEGLTLRIVALADIHACEPWMSTARIAGIVAAANALQGDVIVLLGDYVAGMRVVTRYVDAAEWAPVLGQLAAPLGTYAILGNHDCGRTRRRRPVAPARRSRARRFGASVSPCWRTTRCRSRSKVTRSGSPASATSSRSCRVASAMAIPASASTT